MPSFNASYLLVCLVQCIWVALAAGQRPNIVMIMTDDQDLKMNSIDYQPLVQKYFKEQGTTFTSHYCTIAQCCPSRVSLLTGKAAHNTNVTDVRAPFGTACLNRYIQTQELTLTGGYSKFVEQGLNGQWLPSWFQQGGYNTYYVGKLMNNHSVQNYNKPFPHGFNATDCKSMGLVL